MSKFKVAVFGDRMVDRYWLGEASGLSAEVPIPVVKIKEVKHFPGGAGNVVKNLQTLDCQVFDYTEQEHLNIKNRLMVGDHQIARWDEEDYCTPYEGNVFATADAIIVADYGKGAITPDIIEKIKVLNTSVFVDTKRDPSVWSGVATAVFPNLKEYSQFHDQYSDLDCLTVLKLGQEGLELWPAKSCAFTIVAGPRKLAASPSQARFIRSVNGAGDTVLAAFVYEYLLQHLATGFEGFKVCLDFANAAAAVACENPMTYAPTLKEVEKRYFENCN